MVKSQLQETCEKGNNGLLKTLLGCEIVIALCALIGLYYFLSFAPVKMPVKPIASIPQTIAPLPCPSAAGIDSDAEAEKQAAAAGQTETIAGPVNTGVAATAVTTEPETDVLKLVVKSNGLENSVNPGFRNPEGSAPQKNDLAEAPAKVEAANSNLEAGATRVFSAPAVKSPSGDLSAKPAPLPKTASVSPTGQSAQDPSVCPTVVVGEYILHNNLLRSRARLKALNFVTETEVVKRPTPISRVFIGPFSTRRKALEMMAAARRKGDEPFLLFENGGYKVVVGSFYLQSSVVAWEEMYRAAGFEPKVQKVVIKIPHSVLLLAGPQAHENPDAVLAQLKAAGFPDAHLRL
jgi:flagellar basal body-associated protein FliL